MAGGAILAVQPILLPVLAVVFLLCLVPTGMVSLGSIAMAASYPVLTLIYGLLKGFAADDLHRLRGGSCHHGRHGHLDAPGQYPAHP